MNQIFPPPRAIAAASQTADIAPWDDLVVRSADVAAIAATRAAGHDEAETFPKEDVADLSEAGLLAAPLPRNVGGASLGLDRNSFGALARILATIGRGSLPLGRLYEGHVNALALIATYARAEQVAQVARLVDKGALLGVWNTEGRDGVRLTGAGDARTLQGRKIFASGAGDVVHPLITAPDEAGDLLMVLPTVEDRGRADLSSWRAHGMRASASGTVDFTGLPIDRSQIIGGPGDFHAEPLFTTGAWRFTAVQTGGIAAVFDAARKHLVSLNRHDAPMQRARMGAAAIAVQSARQWVLEAAAVAGDEATAADAKMAFVKLARCAVERAGLDVLEFAHRSVGLAGFQRSHPLERLSRDLATYLRQPHPDEALDDGAAFVLGIDRPVLDIWPWR